MSFNIEVLGGKNYLLPTGGKYCPQDIEIAAIGGQTEGMYCWAKYDTPPYTLPTDKIVTKNMTISKSNDRYVIKSTSGSSGWGANRLDMPLVKKVVFYPNDTSLYMQIGVMKDSNTINQGQANFGMAFYTDGGAIKHHRNGAYVASYGTFTLSDVFTIEFTDTEMRVYKNGAFLFSDNTFNSSYTKLSFECYQGSATIGSFEFGEKAEPTGYVLSDDLNAYPQDGLALDGFYYKLMANDDLVWDERGQYAWAKRDPNQPETKYLGFATQSSSINVVASGNGYSVTTTSAGGWGYNYFNTEFVDTTQKPLRLSYKISASAANKGVFMGFADTATTNYTTLDESLYLTTDGSLNHQRNGTQVAYYNTYATNDLIEMEIYNRTLTAWRNGTQLFSTTTSLTTACVAVVLYTQNTQYGVFTCETEAPGLVGYVIGNEEDAYPNEGYADDGYYYVKVGATKVTPKYASGSATHSSNTITVSGLGFRPYAVMIYYSTSCLACGICNPDGTVASAYGMKGSSSAAATFAPSSDGFRFTYSNFSSYSVPFTWHAVGY